MSTVPAIDACWRRIGVYGSGQCSELLRYVHCRNCPRFADAARALLIRNAGRTVVADSGAAAAEHGVDVGAEAVRSQRHGALVFRLGELVLALDARYCNELAPDQRARRIAHRSGRLLEGLVNIRGELLLCVALDRKLGLTRAAPVSASARLVVVRGTGDPWVFRADAVRGIERYDDVDVQSPPPAMPQALAPHVRGLVQLGSVVSTSWPARVVLLDGAALLAALESAVY